MELAVSPWAASAVRPDSLAPSRKSKFIIGGVAALSASVIAVTPVVQNAPALELQQRAVSLVAAVTDSPGAVYGDLINNTTSNISALLKEYAEAPFPILGQIVQNQQGYLNRFINSLDTASAALQAWWNNGTRESLPGKTLVANLQAALASGDIGGAYEIYNKITLFGIQNTLLPILNATLFSSTTTMGIPQQIAQNVSDAIGAFLTSSTIVYGAFQALYAPGSGASFALARALSTVGQSLASGDVASAVTALVNTPGVVADAFLNGFVYTDGQNPWAGVLSTKLGCSGRCSSGGPIEQFFVTIAKKIATAIDNTPVVATTTTAAATAAVTSDVASTGLIAAADDATVQTVTVSTVAGTQATATSTSTSTDKTAGTEATAASAAAADDTAAAKTEAAVAHAKSATTDTAASDSTATSDSTSSTGDSTTADSPTKTSKRVFGKPKKSQSSTNSGSTSSSTGSTSPSSDSAPSSTAGSSSSASAGSSSSASAGKHGKRPAAKHAASSSAS